MEIEPQFSSKVKRVFNDKRIAIITHERDEFGEVRVCENLITIDRAKEIHQNLENTIKEHERTSL